MERGRDEQNDERRARVAARAQHGGVVVVEEAADQSREHELQIDRRLAADGLLRALRAQERHRADDADRGNDQRQRRAAEQRGRVHAAQPHPVLRPAHLRAQHADADGPADNQGVRHVHDGRGDADAGKRQIAEELAHHDGVHNAVKLLEDVAQNDGQRKIEKGRQRRAGQQRVAFACRAIHLRSRSVRHDDHTRFRVISYFSL